VLVCLLLLVGLGILSPALGQAGKGAKQEIVNVARATYFDEKGAVVTLKSNAVRAVRERIAPQVKLTKSVSHATPAPGDEVLFTVNGVVGTAGIVAAVEAMVDGQPQTLIVLRDAIPAQTRFASFASRASAGTLLYHRSGDPLHTYTTTAPAGVQDIDAVAVAFTELAAGAQVQLRFNVTIEKNASGMITNTARLYSAAAGQPVAVTLSNTVSLAPTAPPDPFGIVFDSKTNVPVSGVRVTLIDAATGAPARVFKSDGSPAENAIVTKGDGRYSFPVVPAGSYRLELLPPPGYLAPSQAAAANLPKDRRIDPAASFGQSFLLDPGAGALQFDIPVDRTGDNTVGLFVQKLASRRMAEIGDFVDYTVRVRNVSGRTLADVTLDDQLPHGFAFEPESARLNGRQSLRSASGDRGPRVKLSLGELKVDEIATVTYRTRVGVSAPQGDGINRAQARNQGEPRVQSNVASVRVQLQEGGFTTRGIIFGKVFVDVNGSRIQDAGEPGIPGVRLFIEDGSYVITDAEGKYSFYGISPRSHVLKLDKITLPPGARADGPR
jgi:uncharacterized repeat protein (TIGR01451 family)